MFLKAGALSLGLLLASRLLGLVRESAQAAAFGASGFADVAVLMLTLPDWFAGLVASGALAYVLVPAWAGCSPGQVAASQRRIALWTLMASGLAALALLAARGMAVRWLAGGLPAHLEMPAQGGLVWSALALPAALLAALWTTRLQHERDFTGMYAANLVVNGVLIAAIFVAGRLGADLAWLGAGLIAAMLLRLAWLAWRMPRTDEALDARETLRLPGPAVWLWAALSAGLPLALPFVARSIASHAGEGALATFNYAWKLVELPLVLAIQLVAVLAFPLIARALTGIGGPTAARAVRSALALAWALACASAAGLWVAAPAVARLLFGWGRMDANALSRVADWGRLGAWSLLPQAIIAVAVTVLAARGRMRPAVLAYALAMGGLLVAGALGLADGAWLMLLLDALYAVVAVVVVVAMGPEARAWVPWRALAIAAFSLALLAGGSAVAPDGLVLGLVPGLAAGVIAAFVVMFATWWGSADLRTALAR
jgi:peptidoglycan biosynthesis protein MviN/MurJ (putative lipid II flippase)